MMEFKEITKQIRNFGKDSASYWGNAMAGEVGELIEVLEQKDTLLKLGKFVGRACNLIKKYERDNLDISDSLPEELADIFIYLELTAQHFNIDLEKAIREKLIIITKRKDYDSFNR